MQIIALIGNGYDSPSCVFGQCLTIVLGFSCQTVQSAEVDVA